MLKVGLCACLWVHTLSETWKVLRNTSRCPILGACLKKDKIYGWT